VLADGFSDLLPVDQPLAIGAERELGLSAVIGMRGDTE
jgi:hypothetical protein